MNPRMARQRETDIIPAREAKTLTGLFRERLHRSADRVAYLHWDAAAGAWSQQTWRQTARSVVRWQWALRREGLRPGDRVAVQMGNRPEWVQFDLAALGLGLITVPLYPTDRPAAVRHILEDAGVRLLLLENAEQFEALAPILADAMGLARLLLLEPPPAASPAGDACTLVEDWLPAGADPGEDETPPVDRVGGADALATIVYTSGTTGMPRGVMLTHRNILWNAEAVLERLPVFPDDRFLSFLPLSHALERTGGYYLPMMAGASVAYARSVQQLALDLAAVRPTAMIAVPRIFERIHARIQSRLAAAPAPVRLLFRAAIGIGWHRFEQRQGRRRWSPYLLLFPLFDRLAGRPIRARLGGRLRAVVSGGAPLAPPIARFFVGLGLPVLQGYGLTEAGPVVSVSALEDNVPSSVGMPLAGAEIRIGEADELLVKSPGVMLGYWRQPKATAEVLDAEGWLHTGDQVRIVDGRLTIAGRVKEMLVLSTGEKVAPAAVELAIAADPLFAQVQIVGEGRPFLAALVVLDPEAYAALAAAAGLDPNPASERRNPRLESLLVARIDGLLRAFSGQVRVPRVAVVAGPWTIQQGLLTPTLKLKRERIAELHRAEVARLYEGHT